jgi:hypothetical protein
MGTVGAANAPGSQKAGARWSGFAVRHRAGDPAAGDLAIVLEVLSIYGYFDFDNPMKRLLSIGGSNRPLPDSRFDPLRRRLL